MPRVPFPLDDVACQVAVVGCGKKKQETRRAVPAEELYTGAYFREVLAACKARYDFVCIVSALHGLVLIDTHIAPYDLMLPWGTRGANEKIVRQFRDRCYAPPGFLTLGYNIDLHAGRNYARWFTTHNDKATVRWADWGPIGRRRQKYRELR